MSMSIFSVTKGGYALSKKLNNHYPEAELYTMKKIGKEPDHLMDGNFKQTVAQAFSRDTAIIFVMATGIVVRTLAPLLQHKTTDPAIIVIDEKGQYVISLLSGHIGGGNLLASAIADKIGGHSVITTSSDVQNKIAIDVMAINNNFVIDSMKDAKIMASAIVNDEKILMVTDAPIEISLDAQWETLSPEVYQTLEQKDDLNVVYVGNKGSIGPVSLRLIPKNIVLGIGCRRDTPKTRLLDAIYKALESHNLDIRSVRKLATVDVKADEIGLIEVADHLKLELQVISRDEIKTIQNNFPGSDFVEKTIGVRAVCEPVAQLSSNRSGKFIMEKTAFEGITIAIWEEVYEIR
jgi:cobalt-precorrin 5A hydrolase